MVATNARYRLREILQTHGRGLARNPQRCDAYLSDLLPKDVNLRQNLVKAIRLGFIEELLPTPEDANLRTLTRKFMKEAQVSKDDAEEVILSWAYALTEDPLALEKINTMPSHSWLGAGVMLFLVGLVITALFGLGKFFVMDEFNLIEESTNSPLVAKETTALDSLDSVSHTPVIARSIVKEAQAASVEKPRDVEVAQLKVSENMMAPAAQSKPVEVMIETPKAPPKVVIQSASSFKKQATKAIRHIQGFVAVGVERKKKGEAQAVVNQLKRKTNQPYYRQQAQQLQEEIDSLTQQLEQESQAYIKSFQALCDWSQTNDYTTHIPNRMFSEVLKRQLKQCHRDPNRIRDNLEADLQRNSIL